jgi:hypothetical protein
LNFAQQNSVGRAASLHKKSRYFVAAFLFRSRRAIRSITFALTASRFRASVVPLLSLSQLTPKKVLVLFLSLRLCVFFSQIIFLFKSFAAMFKPICTLILASFCTLSALSAQSSLAKFEKHISAKNEKGNKLKYEIKDEKNGFYKFCALEEGDDDCSMESNIYDMAVWNLSSGAKIYGYFRYNCGGEGCSGELSDLHFFDANYKEITASILPMKELDALQNTIVKLDGEIFDTDAERVYSFKIPQKGTNIEVFVGVLGIDMVNVGTLSIDKKTGKFSFLKK